MRKGKASYRMLFLYKGCELMARPSKKEVVEKNLKKIEEWTAKGLTLKEIAKNLNISESTLFKYKSANKEFSDTVKRGREQAVEILENSMYKAAVGYEQTVKKHTKIKKCEYENGRKLKEWEELLEYEETEIVPPNMTAAIFLLKNWGMYMNEPKVVEIRQKELEIKEKQVEENSW